MKNLFAFSFTFFLLSIIFRPTYAQSDENRTKMQLTVNFGGKSIVTDLNAVSTSLSRGYDEGLSDPTVKDSVKNKIPWYSSGTFYLTIDVKKVSDELLTVFAKKQNRFDGAITIVDTYGKNPTRTIKFKQASIYSYSDQFSAGSYSENYGTSAISISCKEVFINGIKIEQ